MSVFYGAFPCSLPAMESGEKGRISELDFMWEGIPLMRIVKEVRLTNRIYMGD